LEFIDFDEDGSHEVVIQKDDLIGMDGISTTSPRVTVSHGNGPWFLVFKRRHAKASF